MRLFIRSSAHIRLTAVGLAARSVASTGSSSIALPGRQRHSPGCGDADGRCAPYSEVANGLGHLIRVAAVDPAFLRREQPLIEQA